MGVLVLPFDITADGVGERYWRGLTGQQRIECIAKFACGFFVRLTRIIVHPPGIAKFPLLVEDVEGVDVEALGRAVRFHPEFQPAGANANFVRIAPDSGLEIRTYERGVEGETLACGTGVVAAAVITHLVKDIKPPMPVRVRSGDMLSVHFRREGDRFEHVTLSGPAVRVYQGIYRVGNTPAASR